MAPRIFTKPLFLSAAILATMIMMLSCASGPRPIVQDYDSYQRIVLGDARYITGEGITATETGRGYVVHNLAELPDTNVRVSVDTNPPRSFKFDADAAKRRFLDEINYSLLKSVQASTQPVKVDGGDDLTQQWMKIFVEGMTEEGEKLTGILLMIRQGEKTATIKAVGNYDNRLRINQVVEKFGQDFRFTS